MKIIKLFLTIGQVLGYIVHWEEVVKNIGKEFIWSNFKNNCKKWEVFGWNC